MRRSWSVLAVVVLACSSGSDPAPTTAKPGETKPATTTDPAAAVGKKLDDIESFLNDNSKSLTPDLYEKLVLALETCTVSDDHGIDYKCPALKNLEKARNRNTSLKDLVGASSSIGKKHIGHTSPAVRLQSARMMGSIFGSNNDTQALILEAAAKEKEPAVLKTMINVVGSRHKGNDGITELLMKNAEHANEKVRMESLGWFVSSWSEGLPKTFDKVLEHLDKDPSMNVRAYLCGSLFRSYDMRALDKFEKYLNAKDTPKELFSGCWNGAIGAWTGFPLPDKPQKRAYDLTLKILNTKPRTQDRPPWSGISTLRAAKTEFKPTDSFGNAWLGKVKDWYKKDKLIAGLESLATDDQANWMARTGALDVMQELGAPKATFEGLQKKYAAAATGDNSMVKKRIEDLLKKM
jgi:hypothetical protein